MAEENQQLKELLRRYGISLSELDSQLYQSLGVAGGVGDSSLAAALGSGSNSTRDQSIGYMEGDASALNPGLTFPTGTIPSLGGTGPSQREIELDQLGVDFVLTYDGTPHLPSHPPSSPFHRTETQKINNNEHCSPTVIESANY